MAMQSESIISAPLIPVNSKVNGKPHQVITLSDASIVRRRSSKLRSVRVALECFKKATRASVKITGITTYDRGLDANGYPRVGDSEVGLGSGSAFIGENVRENWCKCGRDPIRLKEVALLRCWMSAIKQLNSYWGELYG